MLRPRVSLRRVFLALILLFGFALFWISVLQEAIFNGWNSEKQNSLLIIAPSSGDELNVWPLVNQPNIDVAQQPVSKVPEYDPIDGAAGESAKSKTPLPRPWFVKGGVRRPSPALRDLQTNRRTARLFPSESPGDRIPDQLMFVPPEYIPNQDNPVLKKIVLPNGLGAWNVKPGRMVFNKQNSCPVSTCTIATDQDEISDAAAVIYKDHFIQPNVPRPKDQIWMLYHLECPYHTPNIKSPEAFNWTATYRRDSDIVTPYERWYYFNPHVTQNENMDRNYAANKTKKVAWFVSNCGARNHRLQYANELARHIPVDIYGACGSMRCPRYNADKCFEILDRDYKFYLAFENSNCRDYITEKFFVNGLGRNILPIVMGARPEDYEVAAPYNSYIHVDEFESPRELAEYLHRLDRDDDLYNTYFKWKGTGTFINTYFWCRVCAMLHDDIQPKSYRDVNQWWRGSGVCTTGSWRNKGMPSSDQEIDENTDND